MRLKRSDEAKRYQEASGSKDLHRSYRLVGEVINSLYLSAELSEYEREHGIQAAIAALEGIQPTSEIEGMLAAEMIATHSTAMECLRRAMVPVTNPTNR